jgi:putative ABC transport system permease protein
MSWYSGLRARMRGLLDPGRAERELRDEIEHHLELETARNIAAGMSPAEARRVAIAHFGGVESVREQHRDVRRPSWAADFVADVRFAVRGLRRTPLVSSAAIVTIALGIGANVAIFSAVNAVILQPLPFPRSDRLLMITEEDPTRGWHHQHVSPANYLDLRDGATGFSSVALYDYSPTAVIFSGAGDPRTLRELDVSGNFFSTLGVSAEIGRVFTDADATDHSPRVVVLTHATWLRDFGGDRLILGRSITLDDSAYQVVGVMPPSFTFQAWNVDLWMPTRWDAGVRSRPAWRRSRVENVVGRLADGVTPAVGQAQLERVAARLRRDYPETDAHMGVSVTPLHDFIVGDTRLALYVLLGSVAILMLIACANVGNLMLVRATARERELALRLALGAGRLRLVRQAIAESLAVSVAGSLVGFLLGWIGTDVLVALQPDRLLPVSSFGVDLTVTAYVGVITVLSAMLFAVAPALWMRHRDPADALKDNARGSTGGRRIRAWGDALVIAEVGLALMLTTGAGLLSRSFWQLTRVDPGFDSHGVLAATINAYGSGSGMRADYTAFFAELMARARRLPGVTAIAQAGVSPLNGTYAWSSDFIGRGRPANEFGVDLPHFYVSPSYFAALRIPLTRGRLFDANDRDGSTPVVVINEAFAHGYYAGRNPVGEELCFEKAVTPACKWTTIIGVVGDVHDRALDLAPRPAVYETTGQYHLSGGGILLRTTGDPLALVAPLRAILRQLDARVPISSVHTLDEYRRRDLARTRFFASLLGLFATVGLVLAVVGVYGVVAQRVGQRMREMGIRIALGAPGAHIKWLFVGDGLRLATVGVLCGGIIALAAGRAMTRLLFNVAPYDPLAFITGAVLLAATTAVAAWVPASRASRADPARTLRED